MGDFTDDLRNDFSDDIYRIDDEDEACCSNCGSYITKCNPVKFSKRNGICGCNSCLL